RCNLLQEEVTRLTSALHEHKTLAAQLEKDLAAVNALSARFRGEGEGEASVLPVELVETPPPPAADSLLPIISSQRERFRQRNQDLEAANLQLLQQRHLAESEVERLRNDNIKLSSDVVENFYSSQYEQQLNPFATFSRQEHHRRYLDLGPVERITLRMGKWILSNRVLRAAAFLYGLLLHGLVFLVLFKLAQTETCKRDASWDCAAKFAEHMESVHSAEPHPRL
uniref:CASP C-terminal domain-containing protein n=1 Tax=Strigamia maritima TaxID=126957 RepID=T1IJV6_STRMM